MRAEETERDNGATEAETKAPAEHHSVYCPNCSQHLMERRCKLVCPRCGYYLSCADYY